MSYDIRYITQFGDQVELTRSLNCNKLIKDTEYFKDIWSRYNPRKNIERYGLCVLNDKGKVGPGPALDSLWEYNNENNTHINETDCNVPTELYMYSKELQDKLEDILHWCCRTHFIKLKPGGFFPVHRDHKFGEQNTFRLIVPVANCNPPHCRFMIEDKTLYWNHGKMYAVDTTKAHTLFNASMKDSIWLVINALVCEESIDFVCKNLAIK